MIIQETWFDADAHDEQIADMWNEADDNSVQKQCQWEKLQNIYEKWDNDHNDHILQENWSK